MTQVPGSMYGARNKNSGKIETLPWCVSWAGFQQPTKETQPYGRGGGGGIRTSSTLPHPSPGPSQKMLLQEDYTLPKTLGLDLHLHGLGLDTSDESSLRALGEIKCVSVTWVSSSYVTCRNAAHGMAVSPVVSITVSGLIGTHSFTYGTYLAVI